MNISPTNSVYYNQTKNERTDKMRSLSQEEIHRRKNIAAAIIAAAALLAVTVPIFGKYLPQAAKDTSHSMAVLLYGNNTYSNINPTISESDNTVSGTRVYSYTSYSFDDSLMLSEGTPLMPSGSNEEKEITVPEVIAPTADDDEYTEKSGSSIFSAVSPPEPTPCPTITVSVITYTDTNTAEHIDGRRYAPNTFEGLSFKISVFIRFSPGIYSVKNCVPAV